MSASFTVTNPNQSLSPSLAITPKNVLDGRNNKIAAELGQIITATVTNKTAAVVSLATKDGFQFEARANKVVGEVGDELRFEVTKAGKNGMELRQLLDAEQSQVKELNSRMKISGIKSMLEKSGMYTDHSDPAGTEQRDLQLKAMEAASKIKRKLRYVANNASRSAMKELLASGVSLEKISIDILSSVMREIEAKPENSNLDALIDKHIKESGLPAEEANDRKLLVKSLAAQGLPPTEQNLRAMGTVLMKLRELELGNPGDDAVAKLLKDEKPLTVESIYLARHTCAELPSGEKLAREKWRLLEPEVDRAFERENILKTEKALQAAWLLLEREIPITAENVDKILFLRELEKNIDTEKLLYQAAGRIKQDRVLADVSVYAESLPAKYENVMAELPFIAAGHLEFLLKRNPEPTVSDCCKARQQPAAAKTTAAATAPEKKNSEDLFDKLLEIRRKLTYEAAGRLIAKKIDITEMKLDQAIENLDNLAVDYSKNLRAMGAEPTAENTGNMSELFTRLNDIQPTTNHVFAELLAKSIPFTVRAVHDQVSADRLRLSERYERFETVITPKHGDSFAKIREQIEPLLAQQGITPTGDNVKAAGILIKNGLDITPENITEIRLIDAKLTAVQDKLHPNIAAAMIKERLNPLDMHINDILGFIDGFNNEYGEGVRDKLTEHIRALDDAKALTDEERNAMIAVYRALNTIGKDENVGLGLGLKYGGTLTLGNLLADAQNFKRYRTSGADATLGDTNTRPADNNIRQMLENIPRKTLAECELNTILIDRISEKATPDALKTVLDNGADSLELSEALDLMSDEIEQLDEEDEQRILRMREGLDEANKLSTETVARLEYAQTPVNIANMHALRLLDTVGLGRMIAQLVGRLADEDEDGESDGDVVESLDIPDGEQAVTALREGETVENMLEDISARIDDIRDNVSSRSLLDELILVQNALLVHRNLGRSEEVTLPVKLSGGIAGLSLYVLDDEAARSQNAELVVALDTPNLGKVRILAHREGKEVKLEISSENPRAHEALRQGVDALRGHLEESGYTTAEIAFLENQKIPSADVVQNEAAAELERGWIV